MLRRRPVARAAIRTTAVVGTAAVVSGHMAAKTQPAPAAPAAPPMAAPVETAPPPVAGGISPEAIEQLTQLAALKDQGILSEEEFAAEKAKILNS